MGKYCKMINTGFIKKFIQISCNILQKDLKEHFGQPNSNMRVSQEVLEIKNSPANEGHIERHRFNPRLGKIPWRTKQQPTPVFLPGKSLGQRSLAGYSPWGPKRVGHNLATKQQQAFIYLHSARCSLLHAGFLQLQ